jgi:hypothetical protein
MLPKATPKRGEGSITAWPLAGVVRVKNVRRSEENSWF